MTRIYRAILTATVLGGLSLPAFAQTPAPPPATPPAVAAPTVPAAPQAEPAQTVPDAGAKDEAAKTPDAKPAVHKHHHASKHKTAAKETPAPQAAQQK